jgi:NAD(P)-dependent dehydrogenase (short-subunit alcohol dehydrogenase family)
LENITMKKGTEIFSLAGKTALITGATGHLGAAMTVSLAEAGAHVLVNSRSEEACARLANELSQAGHSAEALPFDITDEAQIKKNLQRFRKSPLHVLINNAASTTLGNIQEASAESYRKGYEVILVAVHNLLQASLPGLRKAVKETGDASVINIASMYGMVSPDPRIYSSGSDANPPFYGTAKAALLQWTRYAACEFGGEGIRVNAICPGPFPANDAQKNRSFIKKLSEKNPTGRIGQTNEIKGPTLFLASSASSYVNGANIVVDGGWTAW